MAKKPAVLAPCFPQIGSVNVVSPALGFYTCNVGTTDNGDQMEVSRSVYILEIYPTEPDQDVVSFPSHVPVSTEGSGLLCLFASLSTPQSELPGLASVS